MKLSDLVESFMPISTPYGTNGHELNDDNAIQNQGLLYTFFESDGLYYCVYIQIKNGSVGFGTSETLSTNFNDYSHDRQSSKNALRVFNKFIYIALSLAAQYHVPYLRFSAADPNLDRLYSKIVNNQFVTKQIEDSGYRYMGKNNNQYIFQQRN